MMAGFTPATGFHGLWLRTQMLSFANPIQSAINCILTQLFANIYVFMYILT